MIDFTIFFENKDTNFREVWTNALKQPFDKIEDSRFLHAALIPPGPSLDPVDIKVLNFLPFGSYWVLFTFTTLNKYLTLIFHPKNVTQIISNPLT